MDMTDKLNQALEILAAGDEGRAMARERKPGRTYKVVVAKDQLGGCKHLFVFDESGKVVQGILGYGGQSATESGKLLLIPGRGSWRIPSNTPALDGFDMFGDVAPDHHIAGYLQDLWLMLPPSAVVESDEFCFDGGPAGE